MYASNTTEVWCAPPYLHPVSPCPYLSHLPTFPNLLFCSVDAYISPSLPSLPLHISISQFHPLHMPFHFPILSQSARVPSPRGTNITGPQSTRSWVRFRSTPVYTHHSCSDYWLAQFRLMCAYTIIPLHPPPANPPSLYIRTRRVRFLRKKLT